MAARQHSSIALNNQLLSHFIRNELQTAEMAALRRSGKAGLDALEASDRYTTALELIAAINDSGTESDANSNLLEPITIESE